MGLGIPEDRIVTATQTRTLTLEEIAVRAELCERAIRNAVNASRFPTRLESRVARDGKRMLMRVADADAVEKYLAELDAHRSRQPKAKRGRTGYASEVPPPTPGYPLTLRQMAREFKLSYGTIRQACYEGRLAHRTMSGVPGYSPKKVLRVVERADAERYADQYDPSDCRPRVRYAENQGPGRRSVKALDRKPGELLVFDVCRYKSPEGIVLVRVNAIRGSVADVSWFTENDRTKKAVLSVRELAENLFHGAESFGEDDGEEDE
jgi:hypothetical protein